MTTRMVHQYKPKGDPNAPLYAPHRDLAYIYTPMLKEVFAGLDHINWQEYFSDWLEATEVTEGDLAEGVRCFVEAHQMFIRDRSVENPEDAFVKSGFMDLPNPVRVLIFERVGEVVMGGWFIALRDITYHGQLPSNAVEIADMVAAGRCLAKRLSGHVPREEDFSEQAIERAHALAQDASKALKQAHADLEEAKQGQYQSNSISSAVQIRLDRAEDVTRAAHEYLEQPFWERVGHLLKVGWKILRKRPLA